MTAFIECMLQWGACIANCMEQLEKLTVPQLVKKFPAFYGTRRFITAFTRACDLSLS
jgi:hypothetical protein